MKEEPIKQIDLTLSEDMKNLMELMKYFEEKRKEDFFEIFKINEENQGKPQAVHNHLPYSYYLD